MRGITCRIAAALLKVCAGVLLAAQAGATELNFEPRVSLGQSWTDNVNLAPSDAEESEWITELKPGFTLDFESPRTRAQLDYDLQALWFADNSDYDDVFHRARGTGNFVLVPDTLFIDAYTRYDQQNVDPAGRVDYSNFFRTGNRTDALVFGASPYHVHRWGREAESLLRYNYQGVRYTNTDPDILRLQDSNTHAFSGALGSPQERPGLNWRTSGSHTRTDFDAARGFKYERVAVDIGFPAARRTRILATGGIESDVSQDPAAGGLDSGFWYLGFAWEPSELQSLEGRVGERYYGTAWELHWVRRGSRGNLSLDYSEEPTTSSGVLGDETVFEPGFRPGGIARLDTRVFLRKRLAARADYQLVRSTIALRLYADRRSFEDAPGGTERFRGAALSYDWDLDARTRLGAGVDWEQRELGGNRGTDEQGRFSLRATRELTRVLSAVLRASHMLRNSEQADDFRVNQATLTLVARFR